MKFPVFTAIPRANASQKSGEETGRTRLSKIFPKTSVLIDFANIVVIIIWQSSSVYFAYKNSLHVKIYLHFKSRQNHKSNSHICTRPLRNAFMDYRNASDQTFLMCYHIIYFLISKNTLTKSKNVLNSFISIKPTTTKTNNHIAFNRAMM